MKLQAKMKISPEHPTLADHFPGNPIVPGVVIMLHLTHCLADRLNRPIAVTAIKKTRFIRPMLGGQTATAAFDVQDDRVRFTCAGDDGVIASGEFTFALHAADTADRTGPTDEAQ